MMQGMQKKQSMPVTDDVDRDFATMMREHHRQGVEVARMELQQANRPS